MAAGGWIGIAIPAEYGGGGGGITEAAIVLEEVAASGACMNGSSSIHLSIFGMHPVVRHGSAEMRQRYLPPVASGELHVAFGAGAAGDGAQLRRRTRARPAPFLLTCRLSAGQALTSPPHCESLTGS
jgi:acyl-CoA dehydrogenase